MDNSNNNNVAILFFLNAISLLCLCSQLKNGHKHAADAIIVQPNETENE